MTFLESSRGVPDFFASSFADVWAFLALLPRSLGHKAGTTSLEMLRPLGKISSASHALGWLLLQGAGLGQTNLLPTCLFLLLSFLTRKTRDN